MECLLGLLKVRVVRGVKLAICDPLTHSSDPYVVLRLGSQVKKLLPFPTSSSWYAPVFGSLLIYTTESSTANRFPSEKPTTGSSFELGHMGAGHAAEWKE
jgi:hypothetical protein